MVAFISSGVLNDADAFRDPTYVEIATFVVNYLTCIYFSKKQKAFNVKEM